MKQAITIGLDIAKHVFQAHGADAAGHVLFRKRLTRAKLLGFLAAQAPCVVAMGAGDQQVGPHGAVDPAGLRQAVREAAEE